jgi:hypothetical protein
VIADLHAQPNVLSARQKIAVRSLAAIFKDRQNQSKIEHSLSVRATSATSQLSFTAPSRVQFGKECVGKATAFAGTNRWFSRNQLAY